jgi:hypothetical protein
MSRRLGALALALGLLVCSMGLKTALGSDHSNVAVTQINGPDPVPELHLKNGPDPVPELHLKNGPDPVPVLHLKNGPDPVPVLHLKNGPDPVPVLH